MITRCVGLLVLGLLAVASMTEADTVKDHVVPIGKRLADWRPDDAEIRRFDRALPAAHAKAVADGKVDAVELTTYARRYWGKRLRDTDVIDIDLFCPARAAQALKNQPAPRGGGACFLHARWDPKKGIVTHVWQNSSK
ncbi:MAG: hypothetical protein H0T42_20930 [Deltaproteobacteria bacterium]|nr:hypothetical protein [Deltaproteobacteria bacterium]